MKDKRKYNILVIEDNPGDLLLIEDYLEEQIFQPTITSALNFAAAKSQLIEANNHFDIILLDLSLPDKNGGEVIEEINELCLNCPVIVLTGYHDLDFSVRSLSLGIADYLIKDEITASSLYKSIVYNIERQKSTQKLKESEKRYSDLFRYSPQPMWVYDPDTLRFMQVNEAAIELYGYSKDEFLSMQLWDIRPPEAKEQLKLDLENQHPANQDLYSGKTKHLTKSKKIIDVEIYGRPIALNNKIYRQVIAIDITEHNRFEQELTRAIIKTQEDERYEIGGELHDNVCQILATGQLSLSMLKEYLPAKGMEWFNRCMDYIVLATSEISNLSHRLAPAFFDDTTLEEAFKMLLNSVNIHKKYKIALVFGEDFKNYKMDRELQLNLYRILQEQLRNILKYAKASSIDVEMKTKKHNIELRIADNGIGFNKNDISHGIGIANMRRRTELFSGTLDINSSPGNGTVLTVWVPENDNSK